MLRTPWNRDCRCIWSCAGPHAVVSRSLPGSLSCYHNSPFLIHYGNSFFFSFGLLFSHSVNNLCKSCTVKLKPSALCLQTHSCFRVYTLIYHSSKRLILKWCPVKVRWVWTAAICLYNCVLPQSKLSYRVFIKIELPQCELTIFQRHCDMSTKQPMSATRNRCCLAGCSWITYQND